jgi:MoxR-like ATPase
MFKTLFDESTELTGRIRNFIDSAEELRIKYGEEVWKNHYQTVNAVSTYLWLRYPNKYYIFKYQDCKNATEKMGCTFSIKKGEPMDNVIRAFKLFDSVAEIFKKDEDIINIRENYLDNECYADELFRTFAIDFIYYASRQYDKNETEKGGDPEMTIKEKIQNIKSYIAAKGFNYEGQLIENFYLSLKSKPFVILAGTSGTGKTKLVKLFAEAIGAEMKLVPVRPDWSDSSDLFGHVDLAGNFKAGAIIDFVKQAELDKDKPYFLCLDEMNLARVEYYLSDFLSIIETRDRVNGEIITDPLVSEEYYQNETAKNKYGKLIIPENLYIIGTVNMDETTFPFSKKVLDRANTIEFSFVNFMPKEQVGLSASALQLDNSFLKTKYLYFNEIEDEEFKSDICFKLEELNEALRKANLHVGYRVRDEISFYMINNKECELLDENAAFDNEIMQKILPRIQGSSGAIKQLLCDLFVLCAGDYSGFTGSSIYEQMSSYVAMKDCKYPNTAKKIVFMMRRYEEDGFTSYWL